jgi:small subunit ribosomal protein S18
MARKRKTRRAVVRTNKKCYFHENEKEPLFSNPDELNKFLTDRGKILPAARSGLCSKHQKAVARAVKQARHLALLPFVVRG